MYVHITLMYVHVLMSMVLTVLPGVLPADGWYALTGVGLQQVESNQVQTLLFCSGGRGGGKL
jgi:hypothetical protein